MAAHTYRRDIQGLRAVAVVLVVLYHSNVPGFSGGFVGVDVFFVISGFVIGSSLFRELDATGTISLPRFFARRVRRLLPAFATATAGGLILTTLLLEVGEIQRVAATTAFYAAISASNIYLYFTGDRYFFPTEELNPFLHTWSLGVEEQFYLIAPGLLLIFAVTSRSTRWTPRQMVAGGVGLLAAVSLTLNVWWVAEGSERLAFYSPFSRFWEIGLGLILAAVPAQELRLPLIASAAGWLGLAAAVVTFGPSTAFPGIAAALPVVAIALFIIVPSSGLTKRLLEHDAAVWIGDRSYGWYLWHWPLTVVASATTDGGPLILLAAAIAALVPTALSYSFIEQPIRSAEFRLRGGRLVAASFAVVALVLGAATTVRVGAQRAWGLGIEVLEADNIAHSNRCHAIGRLPDQGCTFEPVGRAYGTVLLLGDSHAAALSDGVVAAVTALGYRAVVFSANSCPFVDVETVAGCGGFRMLGWELVELMEPDLVLVSHSSGGYVRADGGTKQVYDAAGVLATDRLSATQIWEQGFVSTRDRLAAAEVALASIDQYPSSGAAFGDVPTILSPERRDSTLSLDDLADARNEIVEAEHSVLGSGMSIDVAPAFCDTSGCRSTGRDGTWLYYDRGHLNRAGSLAAAPIIETELRRILTGLGHSVRP